MKKPLFIDTSYILALVNTRDAFHRQAMDLKEWGLTDCISFVVMKERKLTHALTSDHHFEQAGFQVLLGGESK